MRNNTKKHLSLLLAIVMLVSIIGITPVVFGDDLVAINSTNFTDDTFREIVSEKYDKNSDGYLSESERSTSLLALSGYIDPDEQQIKTLKGVEFFTNLKILRCGGVGLETLDTSSLTNLTTLSCEGNELTTLDVSNNTKLQFLNCSVNSLTSLTLPSTTTLATLYCQVNFLTNLDLENVIALTDLMCYQNELTSLDLSNNTKLASINCSKNHMTAIDLSSTSLENVTKQQIGNQTVEVQAYYNDDYREIVVPFSDTQLNDTNYVSSSLDEYNDGAGYCENNFVAYDVNEIKDGISYECSPMIESSENMTVQITVLRDFYQVDFYTNDTLTERLESVIVNSGENAVAPVITDAPQCKTFDSWSSDITNVTEDKEVYIVWKDSHSYSPTAIADDNDLITVSCAYGDSSYQVSFISIVNSKTGDSNFDENIDVVKDGYINAKDYHKLLSDLK